MPFRGRRGECISRESNLGHIDGKDVFCHQTTDAAAGPRWIKYKIEKLLPHTSKAARRRKHQNKHGHTETHRDTQTRWQKHAETQTQTQTRTQHRERNTERHRHTETLTRMRAHRKNALLSALRCGREFLQREFRGPKPKRFQMCAVFLERGENGREKANGPRPTA